MNNRKAQRLSQKPEPTMVVVFRRTGERRYAVEARRPEFPDLEMNPAPGYDALIPHDLMHMVVEAQLGLSRGVFGQLAAGGDAGTFHPLFTQNETSREMARVRTHVKERGKKLLREGRDDCAQSERATYICWQYWLARAKSTDLKATSRSMAQQAKPSMVQQAKPSMAQQAKHSLTQQAKEVCDVATAREVGAFGRCKLEEISEHLDTLSSHWSNLKVGESLAVRWPDLAVAQYAEGVG